jgi:hypothetical protein
MRQAESIYIRPRRTGMVRGQTLIKSINPKNQSTGNISLTYEEWDMVHSGEIQYLAIHQPGCKVIFLEVTNYMINSAWTCEWRSCVIMSYTLLTETKGA